MIRPKPLLEVLQPPSFAAKTTQKSKNLSIKEFISNFFKPLPTRAQTLPEGNAVYSPSITIYHDTEAPTDPIISSISSPSYNPIVDFSLGLRPECGFSNFSAASNCPITKDTQFTTNLSAERQSDIEYKLTRKVNGSSGSSNPEQIILNGSPNNIIDTYTLLQRMGKDGFSETEFNLGESSRDEENPNCTATSNSPIVNRRIGICNDGIYNLQTRSTDTAGNSSNWIERSLERDSVSPGAPQVNLAKTGDILSEFLGLEVAGEGDSKVEVSVTSNAGYASQFNFTLNQSGVLKVGDLIGKLQCESITYTITISLIDRAGNISQPTTQQIVTLPCPVCASKGTGILKMPVRTNKLSVTGEFPRYQGSLGLPHAGMDFAADSGTVIYASDSGIVKQTMFGYTDNYGKEDPFSVATGWGNHVIVDHGGMITIYAHLAPESVPPVKVGDVVNSDTIIGKLGSTGSSTGFHLHFQVEVEGSELNPIHYKSYHRYPPVNPRIFLGDISSNLTVQQEENFCNFVKDPVGGSANDPWVGVDDITVLGKPEIHLKINRNNNISEKKLSPLPAITYLTSKNENAEIFGLALYKNKNLNVFLEKEYCKTSLLGFCFEWDYKIHQLEEQLEHSEVQLTKSDKTTIISQLWNDDPPFEKGKWKSTFSLSSGEIGKNESICVKNKIYGTITLDDKDYKYDMTEGVGNCRQLPSLDSKYPVLNDTLIDIRDPSLYSLYSFNETLKTLSVLETFYSDKIVAGIAFRSVYEPEWYWDYAVLDSNQYTNLYYEENCNGLFCKKDNLPECDLKACGDVEKTEINNAITRMKQISGCITSCDGKTADRLFAGLDKDPVNIGHVFAGLTLEFFPNRNIFNIDTNNIRTYTGDYGGAINTCYEPGSCESVNSNDEKYIDKWIWEGVFEKADLPADVDAYSIIKLYRDYKNNNPSFRLSNALEDYYGIPTLNNSYYLNRYAYAKAFSLDKDFPSKESLKKEIFVFAHYLSKRLVPYNYKENHKNIVTDRIYKTFACFESDKSTGGSSKFNQIWSEGETYNTEDAKRGNIEQGRNLYFVKYCS